MNKFIRLTSLVGAMLLSGCNMNMMPLEKRAEYNPEYAYYDYTALFAQEPKDVLRTDTEIFSPAKRFVFRQCQESYRKDSLIIDGRLSSVVVYDTDHIEGFDVAAFYRIKYFRSNNHSSLEQKPFQVNIYFKGKLKERYLDPDISFGPLKPYFDPTQTGAVTSFRRIEMNHGFTKRERYTYRNNDTEDMIRLFNPDDKRLATKQE